MLRRHSCYSFIAKRDRSRTWCYLRRGQGRRAYIYHYIYQIVHFPVDLIGEMVAGIEGRFFEGPQHPSSPQYSLSDFDSGLYSAGVSDLINKGIRLDTPALAAHPPVHLLQEHLLPQQVQPEHVYSHETDRCSASEPADEMEGSPAVKR
ncbi:hypothetical protein MHYP_G00334940 [Metynnis hypsauchen]